MLLGDNDSSASEVGVDDGGLRAESAAVGAGLLDPRDCRQLDNFGPSSQS